MKWSAERKWITGGFGLALVITGIVSFVSYQNAMQLRASAAQVKQIRSVLKTLTDISASLTDAESSHWSYLLFKNPDDLRHYNAVVQKLDLGVTKLHSLLAETPEQQQRLATLDTLIAEHLKLLQQQITLDQAGKLTLSLQESLIVQANRNQQQIHQVLAELQTEEDQLFQIQVNQIQASLESRMIIEILGTLLAFAVLFGVYAQLYRQLLKRQQLEAIQRTLEKEKELGELKLQFFSMVSHEFRTPFSIILGSAQLLKEALSNLLEDSKLKHLHRIQAAARHVTQLLNDILTLARADAGKLECQPVLIEVQEFCLNLVEDIQLFCETKRLIQFFKQGSCTHAKLDEKLLYTILSNILSNAIKYSPPDRPIQFTLICEPEVVTFQIQDQGIGIAPEDQAKLYEPFSRGGNIGHISGSGLGMAVLKKCLDLHQGEISLESTVGVGTTFTVKIPQFQSSSLRSLQSATLKK